MIKSPHKGLFVIVMALFSCPPGIWSDAEMLSIAFVKVAIIFESAFGNNIRDTFICISYEDICMIEPVIAQVLHRGNSHSFFENSAEIVFVYATYIGKFIKRNAAFVIISDLA